VELYRSQDSRAVIVVHSDPALPPLHADRGRLRQVLNNLLANGLEAVEGIEGGQVTLTTHLDSGPRGKTAVMMVVDNGHGFKPEMLARVFDPYVTSKPKGTGLGLSIVKKIVEEHGGRIAADNAPGGGASVRVELPVAVQQVQALPVRGIA
jgi:signal transduction histidine kinase